MTMKAAAFHRSRPSGPEASNLALRAQHEAVRKVVKEGGSATDRAVAGTRPKEAP